MRRLGKQRRSVADSADVDAADAHGLQHRGAELELDPFDAVAA